MASRLDQEIERLQKEYEEASVMSRSVRVAQSRLISALTQNSDAVSKSVINTLQRTAANINGLQLEKQAQELHRKRLEKARQQNAVDSRHLTQTTQNVTENRDRIRQLNAVGRGRTRAETLELNTRIAYHRDLVNDNRRARELEKRSRDATEEHTKELKNSTTQIRNMKLTAMADAVSTAAGAMSALTSSVRKIQQQFGVSADQAAKLGLGNLRSSLGSFVDALTGSAPAATIAQIAATQESFQEQFGGILDPEAAKRLTQEAIKMGVTSQQLATARRVFMTSTMGNLSQANAQVNKFIGEFKAKGLTAKDAMMAISQNSELLARNGTRFAASFARAAADAKKIGIDLGKISQVGDNIIDDFEGFLESQASLGAMGFGFDSNRLAQIAATGDDAALFNELRSQLANTGKDITKLSRPDRLELEKGLGISISELQRLAGPTVGSGEKTVEQLTSEGNSLLSKIFNVLEGLGGILKIISTAIAGTIALSTAATAINTGILAGVGLGGIAVSLGLIAASVGTILTIIQLWKFGQKLSKEGDEAIKRGETAKGVIDKSGGRMFQVAGVGMIPGALMIGAGGLMSLTGIGAAGGVPLATAGVAALKAGAIVGGLSGAAVGAGEGIYAATKKGDDVISQPGYGKRSLITPSGVIALNNKDNIVAYADDLVSGTTKLPFGAIASNFRGLDNFELKANAVFSNLGKNITSNFQGVQKSIGNIFSGITSNFAAKGQSILGKFTGGLTGGIGNTIKEKAMGVASKIPGLGSLLGGGGIKEKAMGFASKIPGLGSLLGGSASGNLGSIAKEKAMGFASKIPGLGSLLGGGGQSGIASKIGSKIPGLSNILSAASVFKSGGAVGALTSVGGTLAGRAIGGAIGTAIPIPVVGTMLGMVAGGLIGKGLGKVGGAIKGLFGKKKPAQPSSSMLGDGLASNLAQKVLGKNVGGTIGSVAKFASPVGMAGSALGKIGGLFKKKKPVTVSPEVPQVGENIMQTNMMQRMAATQQPQITVPASTVDTSGIEQKLNNFINALQGIQINMDGTKVGKVLVNNNETAASIGVFGQGARATL